MTKANREYLATVYSMAVADVEKAEKKISDASNLVEMSVAHTSWAIASARLDGMQSALSAIGIGVECHNGKWVVQS